MVIFENNLNTFLGTFISIKFDAKCNETTPVIVLYRFHEDLNILRKNRSEKQTNRFCKSSYDGKEQLNPKQHIS